MRTVIALLASLVMVGCAAPAESPTTLTTPTTPTTPTTTPTTPTPSYKTYEPLSITWEEWALDTFPTLTKVGKEMDELHKNAENSDITGILSNLVAAERLLRSVDVSPDDGQTSDVIHKAADHYGKAGSYVMNFQLDEALVQMKKGNAMLSKALELIPDPGTS